MAPKRTGEQASQRRLFASSLLCPGGLEREAYQDHEDPLLAVEPLLEVAHVLESEIVARFDEDLAELDAASEVDAPVGARDVEVIAAGFDHRVDVAAQLECGVGATEDEGTDVPAAEVDPEVERHLEVRQLEVSLSRGGPDGYAVLGDESLRMEHEVGAEWDTEVDSRREPGLAAEVGRKVGL